MKKKLNKYSFGGFLKKVGQGALDFGEDFGKGVTDTGRLIGDIGLSAVGLTDVIDQDSYSSSWAKKTSKVTDKLAPIAAQIVGGAVGGPGGAAAVQGIQGGGRAINGNPEAEQLALTQQREQREELLRQQRAGSSQVLNSMPTQGVTGSGYYAEGGEIPTRRKPIVLTKPRMEAETTSTNVDRRRMADYVNESHPAQLLNTNIIRRQVPDALEMFVDHGILGRKNPVESVDPKVEGVLRDIAKSKNIKDGKSKNVSYPDYIPNYRPGRDAAGLGKYTDPNWNAANIIGNGTFTREGKDVVLRDTYDFNKPAFPDDAGLLPRIKGYMLNDNPQPGLPPVIANSMKQKAERYFGRKKGSDVNMRIKDVYANGGKLPDMGSPKHIPASESLGDGRHPYKATGTTFQHSKAVEIEQRRQLQESQNQDFKNVLNLGANIGTGGAFGTAVNAGLGVWDTYDNYVKKNDFTPGALNNMGMLAKTIGKSSKVAMGMRLASDLVDGINQRGGKKKLAMGGSTTPTYEVEEGEVVQGQNVQLEEGTQHASDMHEVGGEKHHNGGTEGSGGERVFSDRLKPIGMKESYAELATKLGKDKGRMEKKAASMNEFAKNTGSRMSNRVDRVLDELFNHQEATKPMTPATKQYALGGSLDPVRPNYDAMEAFVRGGLPRRPTGNKVAGWQDRLKANGYDVGNGVWGPKSQAAYDDYTQPMFQQPLRTGMEAMPIPTTVAKMSVGSTASGDDGAMFDFGNAASMLAGGKNAFSKENMSKAGGIGGQIAPYVDNIVNAFIEPAQVQAPNLVSAPQLNTQVDISADLANISTQGRVVNQSIDNSTANAQSARANKIAAFASGLSQTGQLYQTKRREESTLMNQQAGLNAQADNTNAGLKNTYNAQRTAREDNRLGMISANAANAAMDVQGQMRDDKLMKNDLEKFSLISKRFDASGVADRKLLENLLSMNGGSMAKAAAARGESVEVFAAKLAKARAAQD